MTTDCLGETPIKRLDTVQHRFVVAAETFEFVGEIERRQDSEVDRVDRLAASADVPDFLVNSRSDSFRPFFADITRDDQLFPHALYFDAFHKSPASHTLPPA